MDISSVEYFIRVCESKTMTEAAKSLYISQPSLSQSIASFEKYCGYKLFERTNNKLVLNDQGKVALEYCKRIASEFEDMKYALKNNGEKLNALTAYCNDSDVFSLAFSDFVVTYPNIALNFIEAGSLTENEIIKRFSAESLDIAIINTKLDIEGIESKEMLTQQHYVCVPEKSPLYGKKEAYLRDFQDCEFLRGIQIQNFYSMTPIIRAVMERENISIKSHYYTASVIEKLLEHNTSYYYFATNTAMIDRPSRCPKDKNRIVKLLDPEFKLTYYLNYRKKPLTEIYLKWLNDNRALK